MPTPLAVPARPRLGPREWALLLIAGVIVVGILVGILVVLSSVRSQIVEQNQRTRLLIQKADPSLARAPRVLDGAAPVLRDAAPVLKASRAAIPQARRAARETQALLEAAAPVVADLTPVVAELRPVVDDLAPLAAAARPVVGQVSSLAAALSPVVAGLGPTVADLRPVLAELRASDLPALLDGVGRLAEAGDRALPVVASVATEVRDRQLLRRASHTLPTVGRIAQLQRSALETTRMTLSLTEEINDKFSQSLELQRRLLVRVEEIDRKLPGPMAP